MSRDWHVEGDDVVNPNNEVVARIVDGLPAVRRQEFIDHVIDGPRKAAALARQEFEQEAQAEVKSHYRD